MLSAGAVPFLLQHRIKGHARIIWGLSWSADGSYFATASRDGTVKIWAFANISSTAKPIATLTLGHAVTAVAFNQNVSGRQAIGACRQHQLALGLESGAMQIWQLTIEDKVSLTRQWESSSSCGHCAPVKRICWQADRTADDRHSSSRRVHVATCADDHCVRIFRICNATAG